MYCGQCGSFVKDGAQFCPCCGAIMEESPELDEEGEYTGRTLRTTPMKKRRKWPWVLLIILVVLIAAASAVFFWLRARNAKQEDVFVEGKASYSELITDYLEATSANDTEAVLDLFFPNSDDYYQNSDRSLSPLQILQQEDVWTSAYGTQATGVDLGEVKFADLTGDSASAVASTIAQVSQVEKVDELYTIEGTVTYQNGTSQSMVFEVMQCEYGCYLVAIQ